MSRARFLRQGITDFKGGVNIEPENAKPNQVLDCRNVWAPHGILEQRPGYMGIRTILKQEAEAWTGSVVVKETPAGTYDSIAIAGGGNLDLSSLAVGSAWLVGGTSKTNIAAVIVSVLTTNSNNVTAVPQYWNGTEWTRLYSVEGGALGGASGPPNYPHLSTASTVFAFVQPADWTAKTITVSGTDYTKYFLRFLLVNSGSATLDATVTVDGDVNFYPIFTTNLKGLFQPQVLSQSYFAMVLNMPVNYLSGALYMARASTWDNLLTYTNPNSFTAPPSEPATLAVIPQFEESYIAYSHQVYSVPATGTIAVAEIEARPEFVGTIGSIKGDYNPDYVPQLGAFPRANYVEFFKGQLWAANLQEEPYTIRWSAPQPAHKVWPNESYEILMEDDNSPITGLKATGEYLAVFKQDSIWIMVPAGFSELSGLNTYVPVRKVGGIGCVANSSIVEINGNLIFLAEDGVYAFDGNSAHKISEALDHFFLSINAGRRAFSAACHWRRKHCYVLSVSINGSGVNNRVLVYDYSVGAWFFWDNVPAECWLQAEGQYDEETIYFGDTAGNIYQFGLSDTDNGAATDAWILTHRIGYNSNHRWMFREVDIHGEMQSVTGLEVDLYRMDASTATQAASDWRDELEIPLDTMILDTDKVEEVRRRYRRVVFRDSGRWFKVKVRNTQKNSPLKVSSLSFGLTNKV